MDVLSFVVINVTFHGCCGMKNEDKIRKKFRQNLILHTVVMYLDNPQITVYCHIVHGIFVTWNIVVYGKIL